ncbi:MAG: DHH family phosphoesterase [Caldimicrobium sp.]
MNFKFLFEHINQANTFLLLTHENPDIDGLASMLSFFLAHPEKNLIPLVEKIPENAYFLHGIEHIKLIQDLTLPIEVDTIVLFDAQCEKRVPKEIRNMIKGKSVIVFDHHQMEDCSPFLGLSPLKLIDPKEPSTTSLLYKYLISLSYPLNAQIAENLLAGIYYDTGGFRYENVKGDIFLVAHELISLGARPYYIAQALFENLTLEQIESMKLILTRLELLKEGTIALSYLQAEDFQRWGDKGLNDLASFLRSIKDVKIAALVKEIKPKEIKVSLRSKAPIESLPLAQRYGGGGHRFACGFTVRNKDLITFLEEFKEVLRNYL